MKKSLSKILISIVFLFCVVWCVYSQDIGDSLSDMELFKYYWITPLILNIHKEIWIGRADDGISYSYSSLAQNMKNYADIDVVAYLKKTIYPESSLDSFLDKSEMLIRTSSSFLMYLDTLKKDLVKKKDDCDKVKQSADKNFSLALKDFDSVNMEKYLLISIENEKCSVDARINYNAYDKMQSQIKYYYDILQKKYNYFYTYKYDIINSMVN